MESFISFSNKIVCCDNSTRKRITVNHGFHYAIFLKCNPFQTDSYYNNDHTDIVIYGAVSNTLYEVIRQGLGVSFLNMITE